MYPMEHIWTIVMLEICKHTFYAYLSRIWKMIHGFYPESFCDKNLAIRKVFAFSDSAHSCHQHVNCKSIPTYPYLLHRVNQALVQVTCAQGQLCAIEAAVINSSIPPNWPLLDHLKSRQSVIVIKVELMSHWQTHCLFCRTKIGIMTSR